MAETAKKNPSRRLVIAGAGVVGLGGLAYGMRPSDQGAGGHDGYFEGLSKALRHAGIAQPTLIIDRQKLAANIKAIDQVTAAGKLPVRVVVKSLPAGELIDTVASGIKSDRFMVFNGPMLREMAQRKPNADLLLGKPLPATQVQAFYQQSESRSGAGPQWLVDTQARLSDYAQIAQAMGVKMRINFELDVGLHRGGFSDAALLAQAVKQAHADSNLTVAGLMGYDPHVPKTLDPQAAYASAQKTYAEAKAVLKDVLGLDPNGLCLNSAGSPTFALHAGGSQANEVSIGSAFVKPGDFDLKTLTFCEPAAFIATPVIKALDRTQIPSLEALSGLFSALDPNTGRAFFIYGGHWLAKPVSPPGLQYNDLFGRSSNQEMLNGSARVKLAVDDYVFLRPNQSEAIFLQFGDIAIYDGGEITKGWPTFPVSA
jgi:D-serine deaminase-like pyridoxal phosphate-dependent protein